MLRILFSRMLDMGAEALWSKSTKNCKSAGVQELLDEEVATIFFTKNNRFSGSATASNHTTTNHGLGMHVEYFILNYLTLTHALIDNVRFTCHTPYHTDSCFSFFECCSSLTSWHQNVIKTHLFLLLPIMSLCLWHQTTFLECGWDHVFLGIFAN